MKEVALPQPLPPPPTPFPSFTPPPRSPLPSPPSLRLPPQELSTGQEERALDQNVQVGFPIWPRDCLDV